MNNKSQAALEFLTTYAWAFVVILIMVAALAYFGILSPSKLLPDRCNFGSEISCDKSKMVVDNVKDNTLNMVLKNNFGASVVVTDATTVTTDVASAGTCTPQIPATGGVATLGGVPADIPVAGLTWTADSAITFAADCDDADPLGGNQLIAKEKIKMNIEIRYYPAAAGAAYAKIIFGEIFTTIQ